VEPLDRQQVQRAAEIRQATWIRSPRACFLFGTMAGLALGADVAAGLIVSGVPWWLPTSIVVVVALLLGLGAAKLGPDRLLEHMVRSQLPSAADYERGLSAYQRDGGRVWKIGEKPAPKYWDSWAPKDSSTPASPPRGDRRQP
jgi:hypothetical protein